MSGERGRTDANDRFKSAFEHIGRLTKIVSTMIRKIVQTSALKLSKFILI